MSKTDADVYVENLRLKNEFKKLNLPVEEVMNHVPYNLSRENACLENLLSYTIEFLKHRSPEVMMLTDRPFPPIFPQISPLRRYVPMPPAFASLQTVQGCFCVSRRKEKHRTTTRLETRKHNAFRLETVAS